MRSNYLNPVEPGTSGGPDAAIIESVMNPIANLPGLVGPLLATFFLRRFGSRMPLFTLAAACQVGYDLLSATLLLTLNPHHSWSGATPYQVLVLLTHVFLCTRTTEQINPPWRQQRLLMQSCVDNDSVRARACTGKCSGGFLEVCGR